MKKLIAHIGAFFLSLLFWYFIIVTLIKLLW